MTKYHHWITVWLTIYSNTVVYWENEYGESGHLSIFTLLKHLMMLLKYNFFKASFAHLIKDTDSMQLRFFFKVKALLNNAFKGIVAAGAAWPCMLISVCDRV